jgi:hypothetical protein
MPEVRITQRDIANLGRKLEGIEADLSESERALLVVVFHLASEAMRAEGSTASMMSRARDSQASVVVTAEESLPSVRDLFEAAFIEGAIAEATGAVPLAVNIVGGR